MLEITRVGIEYPRNVFPNRYALGTQAVGKDSRCIVGALAPKSGGEEVSITTQKTLCDIEQRLVDIIADIGLSFFPIDACIAVVAIRFDEVAHIYPIVFDAVIV